MYSDDLVGQLIIGLAPHTSGGVLGRIIGWSDIEEDIHPLFHAAKRRNCDGDEDWYVVDGRFTNFSRQLLPNRRGINGCAFSSGTTRLNPFEIKEALNVDTAWNYSSGTEIYDKMYHPKELEETMGTTLPFKRRTICCAAV